VPAVTLNSLKPSWHGIRTVAGLELRQRLRSPRWIAALVAWFVLTGAVTCLIIGFAGTFSGATGASPGSWSTYCFTNDDGTESCHIEGAYGQYAGECTVAADGAVTCQSLQGVDQGGGCYDASGQPIPCINLTPATPAQTTACTLQPDGTSVCAFERQGSYLGMTCTVDPTGFGYPATSCVYEPVDGWLPTSGPLVFSLVTLFILGLGLLLTPALTATSINGDRHAGTLATLQATRLTAVDIALGKLGAAWLSVLAFLVAALPWLATGMVIGSIDLLQVLACFGVLLAELAIVAAIGLGWSALVNRTSGSTLLTYATVFAASVLTIVFMALLTPLTRSPYTVDVLALSPSAQSAYDEAMNDYYAAMDAYCLATGDVNFCAYQYADPDPDAAVSPPVEPTPPVDQCAWTTETRDDYRVDRVWWLLAANPFAIVADAAPEPAIARTHPDIYSRYGQATDLFATVRSLLAEARESPTDHPYYYWPCQNADENQSGTAADSAPGRVWPWGLGFSVLVGALFFCLTVRRLRVPYGKLPSGTRVA
jgi:hypothetical protein